MKVKILFDYCLVSSLQFIFPLSCKLLSQLHFLLFCFYNFFLSPNSFCYVFILQLVLLYHDHGNISSQSISEKCLCGSFISYVIKHAMSHINLVLLQSHDTKMLVLPLLNPLVGEKLILCAALLASVAYVSY